MVGSCVQTDNEFVLIHCIIVIEHSREQFFYFFVRLIHLYFFPRCLKRCVGINQVDRPGSFLSIEDTLTAFMLLFPGRATAVDIFRWHQKTARQKGEEKELRSYNLHPFTDNKAGRWSEWKDGSSPAVFVRTAIMTSVTRWVQMFWALQVMSFCLSLRKRKGWYKKKYRDSTHLQ